MRYFVDSNKDQLIVHYFIIKKSLSFRTTAIFNIALYIVLESQIAKRRMIVQANIAREKYAKIEENTLKERLKIKILEEELQQEKTRSGNQTLELHEQMYDLQKRFNSTEQANEHLRKNIRKSEVKIRSLKTLLKENEKKTKKKENQFSAQSMEASDKLRLSDATINTSRHSEKESELMENINHLQTQLPMEHEKVLRLEVQLRKQQSAREPEKPSFYVGASTTRTETDLNKVEPKISKTDFNVNELNVMVPISSTDSADGNSEGKL